VAERWSCGRARAEDGEWGAREELGKRPHASRGVGKRLVKGYVWNDRPTRNGASLVDVVVQVKGRGSELLIAWEERHRRLQQLDALLCGPSVKSSLDGHPPLHRSSDSFLCVAVITTARISCLHRRREAQLMVSLQHLQQQRTQGGIESHALFIPREPVSLGDHTSC